MKNWFKKNLIKKAYKKFAIAILLMLPEIWLVFHLVGRLQEAESDQSINQSYNQIWKVVISGLSFSLLNRLLFTSRGLFRTQSMVRENNFFSSWVFFHNHSRTTALQGKGEGISLTPHYHFHPLHRHLDISRAITAESSPLHIGSSRTRTGNLWFPSASR